MWLKETLNKKFSNPENITLERYRASKFAFIMSSFLFFLNFYFVWAGFYSDIFSNTLGIMYIVLLLSMVFFVYFYTKKIYLSKLPKAFFVLLIVFLLLLIIFLALPIVVKWWILWIM